MATPVWTKKLSVGLDGLDEDHRQLLGVIRSLETDRGAQAVERSLRELMRYAQLHFAREQAVMQRCGYPGLAHHIEEHQAFKERLRAEIERFEKSPDKTADETRDALIAYLGKWWTDHISTDDRAYGSFIAKDKARAAQALDQVKGAYVLFD